MTKDEFYKIAGNDFFGKRVYEVRNFLDSGEFAREIPTEDFADVYEARRKYCESIRRNKLNDSIVIRLCKGHLFMMRRDQI